MKITICGSIAFYDEMLSTQKQLEGLGHEVKLPPFEVKDENGQMIPVKEYYTRRKAETSDTGWIWERKAEAMRAHFDKVEWCDAILVLNYEKNGTPNYIGANTFLEMGLAFHLNKRIYLLNPIPEISCKEEVLGMKTIILDAELARIKQ